MGRDGSEILDLKEGLIGVRDLYAGVVRLAAILAGRPGVKRAYFLAVTGQLTSARAMQEIHLIRRVLKPRIANRIEVVLVSPHEIFYSTPHSRLAGVAEEVRREIRASADGIAPAGGRRSSSVFEIHKLLLRQALLDEPARRLQELAVVTGYSYSAASEGVRHLVSNGTVRRGRKGAIELQDFSLRTLSFMARLPSMRPVTLLVDATGRRPDTHSLWRRVRPWLDERLAAGGVLAGERWDPRLDLHGLPRLDLHAVEPQAVRIRELGLAPAPPSVGTERIVMALHAVTRPQPLFIRDSKSRTFWADPVDTMLDLYELRLVNQAEALLQHLRQRRK